MRCFVYGRFKGNFLLRISAECNIRRTRFRFYGETVLQFSDVRFVRRNFWCQGGNSVFIRCNIAFVGRYFVFERFCQAYGNGRSIILTANSYNGFILRPEVLDRIVRIFCQVDGFCRVRIRTVFTCDAEFRRDVGHCRICFIDIFYQFTGVNAELNCIFLDRLCCPPQIFRFCIRCFSCDCQSAIRISNPKFHHI